MLFFFLLFDDLSSLFEPDAAKWNIGFDPLALLEEVFDRIFIDSDLYFGV